MSRSGSMTSPTPRSVSATRKLELPSSGAGIASTVYTALAADRDGRQENPDRDQGDQDRPAVEDDLRGQASRGLQAQVDQQVADAVREVEERHRDEDQQVELDDRVAEGAGPGVVVAIDHRHDVERAQDALDQDVHRDQDRGDDAALGEEEPECEMAEGGCGDSLLPSGAARHLPMNGEDTFAAHRPSHTRKKPITPDATAHRANWERTIRLGETGRAMSLKGRIEPPRVRHGKLWNSGES